MFRPGGVDIRGVGASMGPGQVCGERSWCRGTSRIGRWDVSEVGKELLGPVGAVVVEDVGWVVVVVGGRGGGGGGEDGAGLVLVLAVER